MITDCNKCIYCKKEALEDATEDAFKAICSQFFLRTSVGVKPRTVSFKTYQSVEITPPAWCPLKKENKDKPKIYDLTKRFDENTRPQDTARLMLPFQKKSDIDWPRRTEWSSITIGDSFIIPKFSVKPCKRVVVVDKTEVSVRLKELDNEGRMMSYTNLVYKDDEEAKMMVKLRQF